MEKSFLIVVDEDESTSRVLAATMGGSHHVLGFPTARRGLNACCALEPACVIAEHELPDEGGLWLVSTLRRQANPISSTPFVMLASAAKPETTLRLLQSGADLVVRRPFRGHELAAQITALVAMAARMSGRAVDSAGLPREPSPTTRGRPRTV